MGTNAKTKRVVNSLIFNLIVAFAILILAISMIISTIGYNRFSQAMTDQYEQSAYKAADTAIKLVDGNKIDKYISENEGKTEGFTEEYQQILSYLEVLCETQKVSMIFVIKLTDEFSDTPGVYTTYYSVFDILTKEPILPSYYKPWKVGEVNAKTQQIKEKDRDMYAQIWSGSLERGRMIQIQEKGSDMFDHITSVVPIKDDSGKVTAVMCIQQPMSELRETREKYMIFVGIATAAMIVLFVLLSWLYLNAQIAKPLKAVANEAERFAKDTTRPDMPLNKIIKSRISEIETLVGSIDNMETDTLAYINNLDAINAEKQKIGAELDIARQIQESMLPKTLPDRKEFDLYADMTAAKQVGGDFYDYLMIDDDHLLIGIADVSGKGIPAALFMMVSMILINERAMMGGTTEEIVSFVNQRISLHNDAEMFVTLWLGILEISTGKITAVNAGHDDPVIYRNGEEFALNKAKHSLVVGGMAETKYKSYEIQLQPGDKLLLYTDGVPEATRSDNVMFTLDKMVASLNKHAQRKPKELIEGLKDDVYAFVGDAPQFDDMTMLCLEYLGQTKKETLVLDATDENLEKVDVFVEGVLERADCNVKTINKLKIAIEEIYTNIAHYAYSPNIGKVTIKAELLGNVFKLEFEDEGKEYNPLLRDDPDISLDAKDREIGGLGVYMTKKLVDKISYERKDNKNILRMEKTL